MANSTMVDALLFCWGKNRDYGERLVADLSAEQMVAMPAAGANHAAWILCHLNVYFPVLMGLLQKQPFDDPKQHRFGMLSKPIADQAEYPEKAALIAEFTDGHEQVAAALSAADESVFEAPQSLERWQANMPKAGISIHYLMLLHENLHLGQLSAWRRMQGLPSV